MLKDKRKTKKRGRKLQDVGFFLKLFITFKILIKLMLILDFFPLTQFF